MADEAHKEPTMEEILASIRKIISDDEGQTGPAPAAKASSPSEYASADPDDHDPVFEPDREPLHRTFDALTDEDAATDAASPPAHRLQAQASRAFAAPMEASDEADDVEDDWPEIDDADAADLLMADSEATDRSETAHAPDPAPAPAHAPAPSAKPGETMDRDALIESATETAAAGALSRLVSRMDVGSDQTLEGLVKELLRPMIKEWLDANLPAIVEAKVEAEVQRIARMAR